MVIETTAIETAQRLMATWTEVYAIKNGETFSFTRLVALAVQSSLDNLLSIDIDITEAI